MLLKLLAVEYDLISKKTKANIKVAFNEKSFTPPFENINFKQWQRLCEKACELSSIKCKFEERYATSDGNFYSSLGYDCLVIARGGKNPHGKNESIELDEIKKTIELVFNLINIT